VCNSQGKEIRVFKGIVDVVDPTDVGDEFTQKMCNYFIGKVGELRPRYGGIKLHVTAYDAALLWIANFMPSSGRRWITIGTKDGIVQIAPAVVLYGTIVRDADNQKLLPKVEIDNNSDFSSITLTADGTSSTAGFEYFDGTNWNPVPSGGIPITAYDRQFRYTAPSNNSLSLGTVYYWRYYLYDGYEWSAAQTPSGTDSVSPFTT